jgi:adenylate cyclase
MELQKDRQCMQPKRQNASVLFVDIRNFSRIASEMNPGDLADMLNIHYFSPLDGIIYEYRGTLDKHIGDGIMSIFGAPRSEPDDALRSVLCAIRMREEMNNVNEALMQKGRKLPIGIGISTGEVMAGIFGSSKKKEYTVFGHPVNLASRLESLARENQILICGETYRRVADAVHAEKMDAISIKGLEQTIEIYNVLREK